VPEGIRAAKEGIGGVELAFDVSALALATTDHPPKDLEQLTSVYLVSLKRLLAAISSGEGNDLGPVTRVTGVLVDRKHDDVILLGKHEPGAPVIATEVLVAVLQNVWRDGRYPFISIDPTDVDLSKPHRGRWGGFSPGLEKSRLAAIMFEADYMMKKMDVMPTPPLPGMTTAASYLNQLAAERAVKFPDPHEEITAKWFNPVKPQVGDIWQLATQRGSVTVYPSRVEVLCAKSRVGESLKDVNLREIMSPPTSPRKITVETRATNDLVAASQQTARSITGYFGELTRLYPEFKRLHQLYDLVAIATILRSQAEQSDVLREFTQLPVAEVAIPETYSGVTYAAEGKHGRWGIAGGAIARILLERARVQTVAEMERVFERLDTIAWEGPIAVQTSALLPMVRQAKRYRNLIVAETLFKAAEAELAEKHLESAIAKLTQAIEEAPNFYPAYLMRAAAYAELNELNLVEADCTRAIELDPSWHFAFALRGAARSQLGQLDAAIQDLEQALRIDSSDPVVYHQLATARYRKFDMAAALKDIDRAIHIAPNEYQPYALRSGMRSALGQWDECLVDINRVLELNPRLTLALVMRGLAKGMRGDSEGAFADLNDALAREPQNAWALGVRGTVWLTKGDTNRAMEDFNAGLALDPQSFVCLTSRAGAYLAQESYPQSIEDLTAALQIIPGFRPVLVLRADAYRYSQQYDLALADYEQALKINAQDASTHNEIGRIHLRQKKTDLALADFTAALKVDPNFKAALSNRADIWRDQQQLDKAMADYDAALRVDPQYVYVWDERGRLHLRLNKPDQAIEDFSEAIRIDPKYKWSLTGRADVLRDQKKFDLALADYNAALQADPKYLYAWNNRGILHIRQKHYDLAIDDFTAALQVDPSYKYALVNRAECWRETKEYDKALADYDATLRIDPKYVYAWHERGRTHILQKNYQQGVADFTEALRLDPTYRYSLTSLTWLYATCADARYRDGAKAIEIGRRACEATNWKNANDLGNLACAYAEEGDFAEAVKWQTKANELYSPEMKEKWGFLLDLFKSGKAYHQEA
jgi:tetratricopeptide (TPR) repeat protein